MCIGILKINFVFIANYIHFDSYSIKNGTETNNNKYFMFDNAQL